MRLSRLYGHFFWIFGLSICLACAQQNPPMDLERWNEALVLGNVEVKQDKTLDDAGGLIFTKDTRFELAEGATLTLDAKINLLAHQQYFFGNGRVHFKTGSVNQIDVTWFGATPDDGNSDSAAIQRAIDAAIYSEGVSVVYFPPGVYTIDKPLVAVRVFNRDKFSQFNLTLKGHQLPYNNPGDGKGGVSVLQAPEELPFILGIQGARGVEVEKLVFEGFLERKFGVTELIYKDDNELYPQERYAPLAAIVVDPFAPEKPEEGAYEGLDQYYGNDRSSTRVVIKDGVIIGFPTGVSFSPNGTTQQNDSVLIQNMRFSNLVYGVSISQTQSRNIAVEHSSFDRMKYAFTAENFGEENGILPEVHSIKVADGVAWLYKANGNVAYGHFSQVYSEGMYGIGYSVINKQPMHFEGCVFKFRPMTDPLKGELNPVIIRADNASFSGCTFTMGGGRKNIEPFIIDVKQATFVNCYLDTYPVNIGKDVNNPNTSNYYDENLRPNKLTTNNWSQLEQGGPTTSAKVEHQTGDQYFISGLHGYSNGDFVFGKLTLEKAPFQGTTVFTAIGRVESSNRNGLLINSKLLQESTSKLTILIKQ